MTDVSMSLDVLDLCRNFFEESGLNAFSYSRLFNDGSRSEVWSDAAALDHTFNKAKYIVGAYTPQFFSHEERYSFLQNKVETYPSELRERYRSQLIDQREFFDHDHCFSILNKKQEFCEYFIFYAPQKNNMAINFYLNHIDKLESFSNYFLQSAGALITRADQNKIRAENKSLDTFKKMQNSLTEILTLREKDVAKLLITGATIKDVAISLGISPRTAESHVEKMKIKLGCTRKSLLVKQLYMSKVLLY